MKPILYKELSIALSYQCNLSCEHCSSRDSLAKRHIISSDKMINIIREAKELGIERINITGGEPMLLGNYLYDVVEWANSSGLTVTLISNGYWGKAIEKAEKIVARLTESGLSELHLSTDRFHLKSIPLEYIESIVQVSKAFKLRNYLFISEVPNDKMAKCIEERMSAFKVPIIKQPVLPTEFNKSNIISKYSIKGLDVLPNASCHGPLNPFIDPNSDVFLCCTPIEYKAGDLFHMGSVYASLAKVLYRSINNKLAHFLITHGPVELVNKLQKQLMEKGFRWKTKYYGHCDLCKQLFSNDAYRNTITDFINAYCPQNTISTISKFPVSL